MISKIRDSDASQNFATQSSQTKRIFDSAKDNVVCGVFIFFFVTMSH